MIIDGLIVADGSEIGNVHVESGSVLPAAPFQGRLFYLIATDGDDEGLYVFNGTTWITGDISSIIPGTGITGGGTNGDITINVDTSIIATVDNSSFTGTFDVQGNVLTINSAEAGIGVTGNVAGIEIERGTLPNYQIFFDDSTDTLTIGEVGSLESVATQTWSSSQFTTSGHATDDTIHISSAQNILLDGLSGTLTSTHLNECEGASSNLQTQIDGKLDLTGGILTGNLTLAGPPTGDLHAATKLYVDAIAQSLDIRASVKAATTADVVLTAEQTIDDVVLVDGDRVLVKDQSIPATNGIYNVSTSGWTRSLDADIDAEVTAGMFTFVEQGTANAGTGWVLVTSDVIILGTTALPFQQFSGAGAISVGLGLTKSGNVISLGTSTDLTAGLDAVDLSTTGVVAGAYTSVTVDTKGRVTAATVPTTLSGYSITDAAPLAVQYEEHIATAAQVLFTFSGIVNSVGSHRLQVFIQGVKQSESTYIETATDITVSTGITAGVVVEFYYR